MEKVKQMQPMLLYIILGRQFADTFENTRWRKQRDFEAKLIKLESESDIFICMAENLNFRLPITTSA